MQRLQRFFSLMNTFFKIPNRERWLFFEALLLIAVARLAIRFFSFKRLLNYLGTPQEATPSTPLAASDRKHFYQIGRAIKRSTKVAFWRTMCYEQAITAKLMLRRRSTKSTIYIGMMKSEEKGMEGHAWIRTGDYIITGNHELEKYTVVGVFS